MPEGAVYVWRPSVFGNPFVGERAVEAFRLWVEWRTATAGQVAAQVCRISRDKHAVDFPYWPGVMFRKPTALLNRLEELRGKDLCCFCALDHACHADVLLELANESTPTPPQDGERE